MTPVYKKIAFFGANASDSFFSAEEKRKSTLHILFRFNLKSHLIEVFPKRNKFLSRSNKKNLFFKKFIVCLWPQSREVFEKFSSRRNLKSDLFLAILISFRQYWYILHEIMQTFDLHNM